MQKVVSRNKEKIAQINSLNNDNIKGKIVILT